MTKKIEPGDPGDFRYEIYLKVKLWAKDKAPDSLLLDYGDAQFANLTNPTLTTNCDSTITAEYFCQRNFGSKDYPFNLSAQFPSNYRWTPNDTHDTGQYRIRGLLYTSLLFAINSTEFNTGIIDAFPGEHLNLNLFREQEDEFDTIGVLGAVFNDSAIDLKHIGNTGNSFLHPFTGDMFLNAPISNGRYHGKVITKYGGLNSLAVVEFTVNTDTLVRSMFLVSDQFRDLHNLLTLQAMPGDTFRLQFAYIDSDADTVIPELYSTLFRFGITYPIISYSKKGDTLLIDFKLFAGNEIYKHLPGSFSFIFKSHKSGRRCYNRYFSFYLKSPWDRTALEEESVEDPWRCYPNPVTDYLYIGDREKICYEVCDPTGRKLLAGSSDNGVLNTTSLLDGIYFLYFIDKHGNTKSVKFIKRMN